MANKLFYLNDHQQTLILSWAEEKLQDPTLAESAKKETHLLIAKLLERKKV